MNLASTTPLKSRAAALVDHYATFVEQTLEGSLDASVPVVATQLRSVRGNVDGRTGLGAFLAEARAIIASPGFDTLPDVLREDVTKISEELPLAMEHIDNITHPDVVFAALPMDRKHEITERALVDPHARGVLRDLLHFNARANRALGQPPTIPKGPSTLPQSPTTAPGDPDATTTTPAPADAPTGDSSPK